MGRWKLLARAGLLPLLCSSMVYAADGIPEGVKQIPVNGPAGWAKTSNNTVVFRYWPIATHENTQYTAYYDGEAHVVLARRTLPATTGDMRTASAFVTPGG